MTLLKYLRYQTLNRARKARERPLTRTRKSTGVGSSQPSYWEKSPGGHKPAVTVHVPASICTLAVTESAIVKCTLMGCPPFTAFITAAARALPQQTRSFEGVSEIESALPQAQTRWRTSTL